MEELQLTASETDEWKKTKYGQSLLPVILLMAGWGGAMDAFSSLAMYRFALLAVGIVSALFWLAAYASVWESYVLPVGCLAVALAGAVSFSAVRGGILTLINDYLEFLTEKNSRIYLYYEVQSKASVLYAGILLMVFLALLTARAVYSDALILLFIPGVLYAAGIVIGFISVDESLLFLVLGFAFLFKKRIQTDAPALPDAGTLFLTGTGLLLALILGLSLKDYADGSLLARGKEWLHQIRYDSASNSMPEGNLKNLGAWEKSETTALIIQSDAPQKLYLRGMVGEVYTKTSWEAQDASVLAENSELFYWLHKLGFYGNSSIGEGRSLITEEETQEITIENVSACQKYQYLPYALAGEETLDEKALGDGSVLAGEEAAETVSFYSGSAPVWHEQQIFLAERQEEEEIEEYLQKEQAYRTYVYENDLQMTEEAIEICAMLAGDEQTEHTLSEIHTLVREITQETLTYNEQAVTSNGNNDFLSYVVEQTGEGYSVHYATLATLLFRYYGVPARYVEGYFLSEEEAKQYQPGEEILLDETHAHAWTEYYLDGVGWIPFEVTPGFIDEEEIVTVSEEGSSEASQQESSPSSAISSQTYQQNSWNYQTPYAVEQPETKQVDFQFHFRIWYLLVLLICILLFLFMVAAAMILKRRQSLLKLLKNMKEAQNAEAIILHYQYSLLLIKYAKPPQIPGEETAKLLHREALFSNHTMTNEQRQFMETYNKTVLEACKQVWTGRQRFWYHWVRWIYR